MGPDELDSVVIALHSQTAGGKRDRENDFDRSPEREPDVTVHTVKCCRSHQAGPYRSGSVLAEPRSGEQGRGT